MRSVCYIFCIRTISVYNIAFSLMFQVLLPKLKAKPIRTASGVRSFYICKLTAWQMLNIRLAALTDLDLFTFYCHTFFFNSPSLNHISFSLMMISLSPSHPTLMPTLTVPKTDLNSAVQIAVVAVMCKPHRCPHIAMTGNICVWVVFVFFFFQGWRLAFQTYCFND